MAYLFFTQIEDDNKYKVFGFDPDTGLWTYLLSPGPATIGGYGMVGIDRLADGKTYMGFNCGVAPGRVKFHLGSSWSETTMTKVGDQMIFSAMKAFSGGHFYFMNCSWSSGGNSDLYYWNGTTLANLGTASTNIQRGIFMDGESKDLFYICGWRPSANCLYRWNGSAISHIGDTGGPGGGSFGGIGIIGNDIYLQAFSEDFSYWGTACCKLKKGSWGGAWSTLRDFTTTYEKGNMQLNAVAIDRSNGNIWVALKRNDNHAFVFRYNGSSWTDWDLYTLLPTANAFAPIGITAAKGKCVVTAQGSVAVTCYFNGSSWSVKALPGITSGQPALGVRADAYNGELPCDIPSTTTKLLDKFDTGSVLRSHSGNGTITYPGIYARLTAPNGANCQFHYTYSQPPLLYERLSTLRDMTQPGQPVVVETRLASFDGTTSLRIAGLALFTTPDLGVGVNFYSYQLGWYKNDARIHVWYDTPSNESEVVTSVAAADPVSTPHRYRIYWNPYDRPLYIKELNLVLQADQLCFAYSVTECSTWVNLGVRTRDFDFSNAYVGIYVRKWETSAVNAVANFDYFSARQYDADAQLLVPAVGKGDKDTLALEDGGQILDQSGPLRDDMPGVQGDLSLLDRAPVAMEDGGQLLTDSGAPRFDLPEILSDPVLPQQAMALEDGFQTHVNDSDYVKGRLDGDGKELIGYTDIRQITLYDATADPWHTHGAGFYGAGRDGKLYYDGVECAPGDFGTLVGGRRKTAWSGPGDFVDTGYAVNPTITADGEMQCALTTGQASSGVSSRLRWFFTGDFDIQVDYEIIATSGGPTDGGLYLFAYMDPNNCFYVRRHMWGGSGQTYDKDVRNNGSWVNWSQVLTSDTTGKIRLTRVGSTVSSYYWTGSAWAQIGSSYAMTYVRPMYIDCLLSPAGGTANVTVKFRNLTINSGSTTNLIGWAREAAGTYRGSQAEFPQHALIASSGNGIDIIDVDTDKLWMSFRGGTNNLIGGDTNFYVPQVVFKDGTLLLCYRTFDSFGTADGYGYWIDFNLDFARSHRGPTYNDAGFIANVELTTGVWPRDSANGCIAFRNSGRNAFAAHRDEWQYQNSRANWADILHDGGFQYRMIANNGGVYLAKWKRWRFEGLTNDNLSTPDYGISTITGAVYWAAFNPANKDMLYHDRVKLWITHFSTWDLVLSGGGGTWTEDHEFTLAGTADLGLVVRAAQDKMLVYGGDLYYPRVQGVYRMNLATGASTLVYGKAGSGALYEILPDCSTIVSIHQAMDGVTPVLLVGLSYPDRVVAVNMTTNALYWKGRTLDSRTPVAVTVGA